MHKLISCVRRIPLKTNLITINSYAFGKTRSVGIAYETRKELAKLKFAVDEAFELCVEATDAANNVSKYKCELGSLKNSTDQENIKIITAKLEAAKISAVYKTFCALRPFGGSLSIKEMHDMSQEFENANQIVNKLTNSNGKAGVDKIVDAVNKNRDAEKKLNNLIGIF